MQTAEEMRCPECKKISVKLISISDDGKGKKVCRECKREIKKEMMERIQNGK